jgi:RimJ/RimL family protein N-acetyltransferase
VKIPEGTPRVAIDDLILTGWRESDVDGVLAMADDPATRQWSPSMRPLRTPAQARAWMARGQGTERIDWAVRDAATQQMVARVGLHHFDTWSLSCELGYGVAAPYRRRGIARKAVEAATSYAFGPLGAQRVALIHAVGNLASCGVAAGSGFGFEGVERGALDHGDGVRHDVHRHARLADDPATRVPLGPIPLEPVRLDAAAADGIGLTLRPWEERDAHALMTALNDPAIARWNPKPGPPDAETARGLIRWRTRRLVEGSAIAWAVTDASTDRPLGSMALRDINRIDHHATASYWVVPTDWGRGIAPAALSRAATHAFEGLGLHRVQLQHAVANDASCRVAAKAGFDLEGTTRQSALLPDGYVDEHVHARVSH